MDEVKWSEVKVTYSQVSGYKIKTPTNQPAITDTASLWLFIQWTDVVLQVALCFSPVGSKLRVRSRKFPAVVNCTAIDWFHEWPQDALESVSLRFLQDVEHVQVRCLLTQKQYIFFKGF